MDTVTNEKLPYRKHVRSHSDGAGVGVPVGGSCRWLLWW